jgi:hypothetical protein
MNILYYTQVSASDCSNVLSLNTFVQSHSMLIVSGIDWNSQCHHIVCCSSKKIDAFCIAVTLKIAICSCGFYQDPVLMLYHQTHTLLHHPNTLTNSFLLTSGAK